MTTPDWARTSNLRFRRPMLYPIELQVQIRSVDTTKDGNFGCVFTIRPPNTLGSRSGNGNLGGELSIVPQKTAFATPLFTQIVQRISDFKGKS